MSKHADKQTPRIIPYFRYEDAAAALTWLHDAFGLEETARVNGPHGAVIHAEMTWGGGMIMLG
jgi:uncharacterized glyoxalase superfamily protein PhnB